MYPHVAGERDTSGDHGASEETKRRHDLSSAEVFH